MHQLNAHKVGLSIGALLAVFHLVWALMVLAGYAKIFMDWILGLHFVSLQYTVEQFTVGGALLLVVVTGIIGYLVGFALGALWNLAHKE